MPTNAFLPFTFAIFKEIQLKMNRPKKKQKKKKGADEEWNGVGEGIENSKKYLPITEEQAIWATVFTGYIAFDEEIPSESSDKIRSRKGGHSGVGGGEKSLLPKRRYFITRLL